MTDQNAQDLIDEVNATTDVEDGAKVVIDREISDLSAAVARAEAAETAGVAKDAVLAEFKATVQTSVATLKAHRDPLAAAVAAGTPAAPATPTLTLGGNADLAVGASEQFTASASDGSTVSSWSSSDTSIVTVDSSGTVTGVAAGSATISASTGTASASISVNVTAA